ncbi:MAG TPA: hypothetical protein PLV72_02880 [Candidatus Magasanikbacteria bacterium]|nr:hypothetical protein [Candidatus Magasanikbacteria bacterium]
MHKAFRRFLIDSPDAFEMIRTIDDGWEAVEVLFFEIQMPPKEVVSRIFHFEFAGELIYRLVGALRETPTYPMFLREITTEIPEENWVESDTGEVYRKLADEYLMLNVRYYITRRDFRRAWDETRNFWKDAHDTINRMVNMRTLVRELFSAMLTDDLVTPIVETDRKDQNSRAPLTAYDTRPRAHNSRPISQSLYTKRPGWDMACELGFSTSEKSCRILNITTEGAMILKIAAHFRDKRNEKRKAKHLQVLAEYEKKRQLFTSGQRRPITLRGNPFIGTYFEVTNPKDSAFGKSPTHRTCDSCFYRNDADARKKEPDCMAIGGAPKKAFGIHPNKILPEQIDGQEVGYYCPYWKHPEID